MKKLHPALVCIPIVLVLTLCGVLSCDQGIYVSADTLKTPIFQMTSGIRFHENLLVEIQNPNGSSPHIIRYTYSTDGSTPLDPTSASLEWANQAINQSMIIKARAFHSSYPPSPVSTATYFRTWTEKSNTGSRRKGAAIVTMNNRVYIIGGIDESGTFLNSMLEYIPAAGNNAGTWSTKASPGTARAYSAASIVDNKIYVFGGQNASLSSISTVQEFTPDGNNPGSWELKADLPIYSRQRSSSVAFNGKIYIIGGISDSSPYYLSRIDEFTPGSGIGGGSWATKTSLSTARFNQSAILLNDNNIYIIGGQSPAYQSSVEIFNPLLNSITPGISLPATRSQFACAGVNNTIYIFGGVLSSTATTYETSIIRFSLSTNTWQNDEYYASQPILLDIGTAENCAVYANPAYGCQSFIFIFGGKTTTPSILCNLIEYEPH